MQQQSLLKVETVRDPAMLTAVSVDEKIKIDSVVMSSDVSHRVQRMWFQKQVDVHQGCGYSAAVQRARLFLLLLSTKTECDANDRECVVNRRLLFQSLCTATVSSRSGSKGGENGFWGGTARHRSRFVRIQ